MFVNAKQNRTIIKKCLKHLEIIKQTNTILIFANVKKLLKLYGVQ